MVVTVATLDRPTILGGSKAVTPDGHEANRWPIITDGDVATATDVLRSDELSLHKMTQSWRRIIGPGLG